MDHLVYSAAAVLLAVALVYGLLVGRHTVREYQCGLLYRNGKFRRRLGPGLHRVLRPWHDTEIVDLRRRLLTVPGQEILTADQVGLKVSAVADYDLADPLKALHQVEDYVAALHVAVQLALRRAVGGVTLEQLFEQRLEIGGQLTSAVQTFAEQNGLRVHSVEIKDVMLPGEMKKAMSEVARARKEGQAALERARGETAALRNLANAGRLLQDHPALLNLRLLQVLAANPNAPTIVLPAPTLAAVAPASSASPPPAEG